ncbi:PREDICTED: uncharacterized protein LOC105528373 [Mandrillus leucophaeus]|uniref:uncharacterized protein LOC105528373 n=1 Tax=Mandrillus leucophaeus TaxID=9568 RepID=UPI0005F4CAAA|nr:PREDICTED: uncharacterized protein LOC105528373 [Mandrillus leucophaeus]
MVQPDFWTRLPLTSPWPGLQQSSLKPPPASEDPLALAITENCSTLETGLQPSDNQTHPWAGHKVPYLGFVAFSGGSWDSAQRKHSLSETARFGEHSLVPEATVSLQTLKVKRCCAHRKLKPRLTLPTGRSPSNSQDLLRAAQSPKGTDDSLNCRWPTLHFPSRQPSNLGKEHSVVRRVLPKATSQKGAELALAPKDFASALNTASNPVLSNDSH